MLLLKCAAHKKQSNVEFLVLKITKSSYTKIFSNFRKRHRNWDYKYIARIKNCKYNLKKTTEHAMTTVL